MKIYSYNPRSEGAKSLSRALDVKRIKHEGKHLVCKGSVINWGASHIKRAITADKIINKPESVKNASDKLQAFKLMYGSVDIPKWTEERQEASEWLAEGNLVVCRQTLNGHSGEGIIIAKYLDEMVDAPLYTEYVKKDQEYRLHVNNGAVFFVQRKARSRQVADEAVNWQVRNHHNGFIYANIDVVVGDDAKTQAILACHALGLDFGAVDIILGKDGGYYVLEVNTAPGLAGLTLEKYVEQFKDVV